MKKKKINQWVQVRQRIQKKRYLKTCKNRIKILITEILEILNNLGIKRWIKIKKKNQRGVKQIQVNILIDLENKKNMWMLI